MQSVRHLAASKTGVCEFVDSMLMRTKPISGLSLRNGEANQLRDSANAFGVERAPVDFKLSDNARARR